MRETHGFSCGYSSSAMGIVHPPDEPNDSNHVCITIGQLLVWSLPTTSCIGVDKWNRLRRIDCSKVHCFHQCT